MRVFVASGWLFLCGIARHWQVLVLGVAAGGLDVYERLSGNRVDVSSAIIWTVIGVSILLAAVWSYHDLRISLVDRTGDLLRALRVAHDDINRARVVIQRAKDRGKYNLGDDALPTDGRLEYRSGLAGDPQRGKLARIVSDAYDSIDDMKQGIGISLIDWRTRALTGDEDRFLEIADTALAALREEVESVESGWAR